MAIGSRTWFALLVLLAPSGWAGCARVKPWQRARLASAPMAVPLAPAPLDLAYRSKLIESKTGGGLPGVAAGGGCGCTQ